jgi:hypothetical protein
MNFHFGSWECKGVSSFCYKVWGLNIIQIGLTLKLDGGLEVWIVASSIQRFETWVMAIVEGWGFKLLNDFWPLNHLTKGSNQV